MLQVLIAILTMTRDDSGVGEEARGAKIPRPDSPPDPICTNPKATELFPHVRDGQGFLAQQSKALEPMKASHPTTLHPTRNSGLGCRVQGVRV